MVEFYWKNIFVAAYYYAVLVIIMSVVITILGLSNLVAIIPCAIAGWYYAVWIEKTPRKFIGRSE